MRNKLSSLLALGLAATASDALAQAPTIQALPRWRERTAERADTTTNTTRKEALNETVSRDRAGSTRTFFGWTRVGAIRGTEFWGENRGRLLPSSGLAVGKSTAALYSELGAINSAALRFSVGTTIAAASEEAEDETDETRGAFQRFVAGGGNLSMAVIRPLAIRDGQYAEQYIYVQPRGWVNVPTLGDTDEVDDLGGEIAMEYQYHRFATGRPAAGAQPFLVLSLRAGFVGGTPAFYDAIGHRNPGAFGYFAPSATFVIQEVLRLGISGFFAPHELTHQGGVRLTFTLVNRD